MNEHQSGEKDVPRLMFFSLGGGSIFNELMSVFLMYLFRGLELHSTVL